VLAPFLIAPPVIDCLVLIVRRLRAGHSPFFADRNHLHHRLLDAGLSPTGVVAALTGATLAIGFLAASASRAHVPEPVFPVIYLAAAAGYFLFTRNRAAAPSTEAEGDLPAPPARPAKLTETPRPLAERVPEPALAPVTVDRGDS
jgi:UDP-GlcNAc:undecaprenyl-phosphate GlcNAc-1-phosphate transferase